MACTTEDLHHGLMVSARRLVEHAATRMLEAGEEALGSQRACAWSRAEELGHLWDSAQVNHLRILRGLEGGDLVFPGYDQDAWVARQRPGEFPWSRLVEGWRADNLRLLNLLDHVEPELRTRPRQRHNLNHIAFQPFAADEAASLEDLGRDYLMHLVHHLRRISPHLLPLPQLPAGLDRPVLPLLTERLEMRPLLASDLDELAPILADPEVVRHLPGPPRSREQTARTIDWFVSLQMQNGCSAWALRRRRDGRLIGWCGICEFCHTGELELLYCLERAAWGQGLATEAARSCVACAREAIGLPRLMAVVSPQNLASRRVLAHCGLTQRRPVRFFDMDLEWWQVDF